MNCLLVWLKVNKNQFKSTCIENAHIRHLFFFKRVLFLDLLNILQSMFYLSSGASVKSRQVSKSKHKLHLAEKEVGGHMAA